MRKLFISIFIFCFIFVDARENQKTIINESNEFKLLYIGNGYNLDTLRQEYICAYPIYVNISFTINPIDTPYKQLYPNPCAPKNVNQTFIFQLHKTSDIQIFLIDPKDSTLLDVSQKNIYSGFYYFLIKSKFLYDSLISQNIFRRNDRYKVLFYINDKKYEYPLSKKFI